MSELINNSQDRKALLKHMILQLHEGVAPEAVRARLIEIMAKVPYGMVVEVEQELISEGLPESEVLRLCDVHTEALDGHIDVSGMKVVSPGHPVDTFQLENREIEKVIVKLEELFVSIEKGTNREAGESLNKVKSLFNSLMDVDKHYRRKENLLFPFLEKYGITGPPKVMWGKHDETRDLLKNAINSLTVTGEISVEAMKNKIGLYLQPAIKTVSNMILKEEEILLPMSLDKLTEADWYEIYKQTLEIGYCLYDPKFTWKPQGEAGATETFAEDGVVNLPSGKFAPEELLSILNTLPFDLTFVDKNDKVKYFSQGRERIFDRNRAILGRDVRMCHPPSSVHIVDQIIGDFKAGVADSAPFWIQMGGKFIHIEYFALRDEAGAYLGTLEVSQDLTSHRKLAGDQRLLSYRPKNGQEKQPERAGDPVSASKIILDARPLLARGGHPLDQVIREAEALNPGEIFEIITPFPPAPMIEKMQELGYKCKSERSDDGLFHTYFERQ